MLKRAGTSHRTLVITVLGAAAVALFGVLPVAPAAAETVVSCPFENAGGGDSTNSEGFYLSNYPGSNLDKVTMEFGAIAGSYTFTLTARLGAFDGPVIGAKTVPVTLPSGDPATPVTFDFGAVAVAPGSTITFYPTKTGPHQAFFNTGTGPCPGVTETEDIAPPLSTVRRDSVGLTVTQVPAPATGPTGERAAALKKCKKKHSAKKRKKCRKRARKLPV
jgi:plastocyanin